MSANLELRRRIAILEELVWKIENMLEEDEDPDLINEQIENLFTEGQYLQTRLGVEKAARRHNEQETAQRT